MERAVGVLAEARVFAGVRVGEVVLSQEEGLLDGEGGWLRRLVTDFLAERVVAGEVSEGVRDAGRAGKSFFNWVGDCFRGAGDGVPSQGW